jgi:hypothetical protein
MNEPEDDFLVIDGHRPVVFICFGGRGENFAWKNRMELLGVHALHLKDSRNRWYLDGADGDSSFDETILRCRAYLETHAGKTAIVMGQSFGGYAALRAALYLSGTYALAFAPQTHFNAIREVFPVQRNFLPPEDAVDIRPLLNRSANRFSILVSRSESQNPPEGYFWDDYAHLEGLSNPNIDIEVFDYDLHPVAWCLAKDGLLSDVLEQHIARSYDPGLQVTAAPVMPRPGVEE